MMPYGVSVTQLVHVMHTTLNTMVVCKIDANRTKAKPPLISDAGKMARRRGATGADVRRNRKIQQ